MDLHCIAEIGENKGRTTTQYYQVYIAEIMNNMEKDIEDEDKEIQAEFEEVSAEDFYQDREEDLIDKSNPIND